MTSLIANPEQFIFAQDQELKTTSLKIADAFNKLHKDVIRKIENLDCSKDFYERNFTPIQVDTDLGQNRTRKDKAYEITKDGFIFVIMGFTGKKAAGIKEAYINAFNLMHKKLFPVRNALVALPTITPKQQRHIQGVVKNLVNTQVGSTYSIVWGSVKKKFEVGTYKDIPEAKYPDLCSFLQCEPLEGELLPEISLPEVPEGKDYNTAKLLITRLRGYAGFAMPSSTLNEMNEDIDKLECCLNSAWTECDEALFRIGHAQTFLSRWRSK